MQVLCTAVIGEEDTGWKQKEYSFCLNKRNDDLLFISSNPTNFYMKITNGLLGENQIDYVHLEINKNSPFYQNLRQAFKDLLEL